MRLLGKPSDWVRFHAANVRGSSRTTTSSSSSSSPNLSRTLFGQPFTTNSHGLRDREYAVEKPAGVFRIAVLGSSIDMGWGVGTEETYVNLLEDWLNAHAAQPGAVPAVRGAQLRRRRLQPDAAARGVPPQGAWRSIPTWCSTRRPCSTPG